MFYYRAMECLKMACSIPTGSKDNQHQESCNVAITHSANEIIKYDDVHTAEKMSVAPCSSTPSYVHSVVILILLPVIAYYQNHILLVSITVNTSRHCALRKTETKMKLSNTCNNISLHHYT